MFLVLILIVSIDSAFGQAEFRMYGSGEKAAENEFPYIVSIREIGSNTHICGGSIISAKTVLTVAHCLEVVTSNDMNNITVQVRVSKTEDIYVSAGSNSLTSGIVETYRLSKIVQHKGWVRWRKSHAEEDDHERYDIGILILKDKFNFSNRIKSIELNFNQIRAFAKVTFAGWGDDSGSATNYLHKMDMETIPSYRCRQYFKDQSEVSSTNFCAIAKFSGICDGDSGSPLVLNGNQIGIASRTLSICGDRNETMPQVFMRLSKFYGFIDSEMAH